MKKQLLFIVGFTMMSTQFYGQEIDFDTLSKGRWSIGTTLAPLGGGLDYPGLSYSLGGSSSGRIGLWSIGAELGYFMEKNLELKAGLGYTFGSDFQESLTYMLGLKYYIKGKFTIQVDYSGRIKNDRFGRDVDYLGIQAGYAFFLGKQKNFSIEPSIKYNINMNGTGRSFFQFNTGFFYRF